MDDEALGAARLVHVQVVLLSQTSRKVLAAGSPGSGTVRQRKVFQSYAKGVLFTCSQRSNITL